MMKAETKRIMAGELVHALHEAGDREPNRAERRQWARLVHSRVERRMGDGFGAWRRAPYLTRSIRRQLGIYVETQTAVRP